MSQLIDTKSPPPQSLADSRVADGIVERREHGVTILSPARATVQRRVLYVNSYGGEAVWQKIKAGIMPSHHLWGCLELVRRGYEVALAEPLPYFYFGRRCLPHDLAMIKLARTWLRNDDIIYAGHTVLYWLPLLKSLGAVRCKLVSQCFAREELDFRRVHDGVVALTPPAAKHSKKLAPKVRVAHPGWGVDLNFFPVTPYQPEFFLSCGIANRDFTALSQGAGQSRRAVTVICPGLTEEVKWSPNVKVIDGGRGWNSDQTKLVTAADLVRDYYPKTAATLVIMKADPTEYTANGFTNLIEAMAMGRPVIVTRTGALPVELDVEKAGCGLHVPAGDSQALAAAIETLAAQPERARIMGETGRRLCEKHYNSERYGRDLHAFFESL